MDDMIRIFSFKVRRMYSTPLILTKNLDAYEKDISLCFTGMSFSNISVRLFPLFLFLPFFPRQMWTFRCLIDLR
jgi:hypothetical protein